MGSKRQTRPEVLPVTTARAHLFDLVEDVLTGRIPHVELALKKRASVSGAEVS